MVTSNRRSSGGLSSLIDESNELATSSESEQQNLISRGTNGNNKDSNEDVGNQSTSPSKIMGSPRKRPGSKKAAIPNSANMLFNPTLIFSQIMALQCFHYFFSGLLMEINNVLFGTSVTLDRLFTAEYLDLRTTPGWIDNGSILVSYIIGALLLAIIVEKAKKCLDFSVTLFFIHLMTCIAYDEFPASWDWWIIHVLGTIIMILLGEFFCSRRELMDIPLLPL